MKTINLEIALKWWSTLHNSQKAIINDEFDKGMRHYSELEDEDVLQLYKFQCEQAYNETFNPEAHSSLIIDFDKVETIEETGNKIFEEDSLLYEELIDGAYSYSIGVDFLKRFAIKLAESDAARNYWFKVFQKEQKTIKQLFEELSPLERAELIQGYCDECGQNTRCYCKNDE